MRARFSIWERCNTVYFDDSCLPELEDHGVGVGGGAQLVIEKVGRSVIVNTSGEALNHVRPSSLMDNHTWPYLLQTVHGEDEPVGVRCGVMVVDLTWAFAGYWSARLPLDHDLPWPHYHQLEVGGNFDKHASAVREIRLRLKSAGEARITIPQEVQKLLTPEERVGLFQNWKI